MVLMSGNMSEDHPGFISCESVTLPALNIICYFMFGSDRWSISQGQSKEKGTSILRYNASRGRCCLVHTVNTEEEQTLKQTTNNICYIRTLSYGSVCNLSVLAPHVTGIHWHKQCV